MKKDILILGGGKSEEHEISLLSAKSVVKALDRNKYNAILVGVSKEGTWYLEEEDSFTTGGTGADTIQLNTNRPTVSIVPFVDSRGRGQLMAEGKTFYFDVAFPMFHGTFGEDGSIQGFFNTLGVPYVGADCQSSSNSFDKRITRLICESEKIPMAKAISVRSPSQWEAHKSELQSWGTLFVKGVRQGSSVGVSKVESLKDLPEAISHALKFDEVALVEQAIIGREVEISVLGTPNNAKASLPGEVIPSKEEGFYSYQAKYFEDSGTIFDIPAKLEKKEIEAFQELAIRVFSLMEVKGMARVDGFLESGTNQFIFNELNTLPGFTAMSMYPKMWASSGLNYPDLVSELIELA